MVFQTNEQCAQIKQIIVVLLPVYGLCSILLLSDFTITHMTFIRFEIYSSNTSCFTIIAFVNAVEEKSTQERKEGTKGIERKEGTKGTKGRKETSRLESEISMQLHIDSTTRRACGKLSYRPTIAQEIYTYKYIFYS